MPIELSTLWPELVLPLGWGILVGLVFSLVGAAGGILASFGLISVIGLTDANQVKPMAQVLTLATPLIAVPHYLKQCRVVLRLGLILATGGLLGALVGSRLSMQYLADLSDFKPAFTILVLFIAAQLAWSLRPGRCGGQRRRLALQPERWPPSKASPVRLNRPAPSA